MYTYSAKVLRVIDGDSVEADVDLGFKIHQTMTLRLYGINAPELHAADPLPGRTAQDFLKTLVEGKDVTIRTHKDKTEKYGRMLAEIWVGILLTGLPNDLDSVNTKMIGNGFAVPYFGGKR